MAYLFAGDSAKTSILAWFRRNVMPALTSSSLVTQSSPRFSGRVVILLLNRPAIRFISSSVINVCSLLLKKKSYNTLPIPTVSGGGLYHFFCDDDVLSSLLKKKSYSTFSTVLISCSGHYHFFGDHDVYSLPFKENSHDLAAELVCDHFYHFCDVDI